MLFRVDFLIGEPGQQKNADSFYILANDRDDAIERSQSFTEKAFPKMDLTMEAMTNLPVGTIISCFQSMEFTPKDATVEPPVVFNQPSVLIS